MELFLSNRGIHEKMAKLKDEIDGSIDEIKDIFDMMTERPEEEDNEVQDLFDGCQEC